MTIELTERALYLIINALVCYMEEYTDGETSGEYDDLIQDLQFMHGVKE
jgi:hypothetical protein